MSDNGCLGPIIIFILVIGFIGAIIAIIVSVGLIILAGFGAVGAVVGLVISIKNFVVAIREVKYDRDSMKGFKSANDRAQIEASCPNGMYDNYVYEDVAAKNYFLGPCFRDIISIIKVAMVNNFNDSPSFEGGEGGFWRPFFIVKGVFQAIAIYVLGPIFTIALSLVMLIVFAAIGLVVYPCFGIVLLIETIVLKIKKVSYRCPVCKHSYEIPVYACPICHIRHVHLRPGRYGIFRRKCVCDARIPVVHFGKVFYRGGPVAAPGDPNKECKLENLDSYCPQCHTQHNAGLSHPISIALIGGASAGKTTFKVAFLHDFIDEEAVKFNLDCEFPSKEIERDYNECISNFNGRPIAATTHGADSDITTFSFFMKNKKFESDRMIHLYDMPGEVFQSGEAKEGWNLHTFNDGAVFLLDPYSLSNVREQNAKELQGSMMGTCTMNMDALIESLIDTLRQVKTKQVKGKFAIPIALTINKADSLMLKRQIGDEAVQTLMQNEPEVFKDYFVTMDYLCRCFLAKNEG